MNDKDGGHVSPHQEGTLLELLRECPYCKGNACSWCGRGFVFTPLGAQIFNKILVHYGVVKED